VTSRTAKGRREEQARVNNKKLTDWLKPQPAGPVLDDPEKARKCSVANISSKLASLGINKTTKKTEKANLSDSDIDQSLYLWPSYLFPELDDPNKSDETALFDLGLELVGLEHDSRDIILDLKHCFLEVFFFLDFLES
jgi:hypothetical protein